MQKLMVGVVAIFMAISWVEAQQLLKIETKDHPVICYARHDNCASHVDPPQDYLKRHQARIKTATIEVTYNGNFPAEAIAAFNEAVGIWESLISSDVPIKIQANWSALSPGVLGSAIYWSAFANFDGAQKLNVFYPVALAEKMAGKELNGSNDFEIFANFNASINWYYGGGAISSNQFDFVTVVLHEIGHGLGFSSSFSVEGTQGQWGAFSTEVPIVFDAFVENGSGVKLVQGFSSPSAALRTQLTSNNLRINVQKDALGNAFLYAPTSFDGGSSISHLDETGYPAGSLNALMSPQIGFQEVNHNPGPITLGILSDMGWEIIRTEHTPLSNTETTTGPYTATIKLFNDEFVQYNPAQVKLNYTSDGTNFTSVTMADLGNDVFTGSIPTPPNIPWTYGYFISVGDTEGRTLVNPGKIVRENDSEIQNLHIFEIGPDSHNPIVIHTPDPYLRDTETELQVSAFVTDNIGIGTVTIDYKLNNETIQSLPMTLIAPEADSVYTATLTLGTLADGDVISYKITAVDNSNSPKTTISPAAGFHTVGVVGFGEAIDTYTNNFNSATSDFFGNGFTIATPTNFTNGAIHSTHPYPEGDAFPEDELEFIYVLKYPIRVASENTWLRFDEIVLVEPGDAGSVFGDPAFYDYVVVEASKDLGETWTPLANGYDSRSRSEWLARYNSSFSGNNSTALGIPSLYRSRGINLLDKFVPDDEILIRFRLFSDQLAAGWGWSIDNLYIQDPITSVEDELESKISVYPNPARNIIMVEADVLSSSNYTIQVVSPQGQSLYNAPAEASAGKLSHTVALQHIPVGLYLVKISDGRNTVIRKIMKVE